MHSIGRSLTVKYHTVTIACNLTCSGFFVRGGVSVLSKLVALKYRQLHSTHTTGSVYTAHLIRYQSTGQQRCQFQGHKVIFVEISRSSLATDHSIEQELLSRLEENQLRMQMPLNRILQRSDLFTIANC